MVAGEKLKYLIACPIFEDELNAVLSEHSSLAVHKMDYRIHNNPDRLEKELIQGISEARSLNAKIRFLVGNGCDCDHHIDDIAKACNAKHPLEKNCIEILIGADNAKDLQQNRTMLITPAWMRMMHKAIKNELLNEDDARITIGWFDRILLLDPGVTPYTDQEILEFYDLVQVPVEIKEINLGHFQATVNRLLE